MIKKLSWEFTNRRRAIGYLKWKSEQKEYAGNKYMMFVIRHVLLKSKRYKVHEYAFSASKHVLEDLKLIRPNSLMNVFFEIKTKEKEPGWHTTSLRALEVFQYGDTAEGWYWEIQDGMEIKEGKKVKELIKNPPDIMAELRTNPVDKEYQVKDYIKKDTLFTRPAEITDEDEKFPDLPF